MSKRSKSKRFIQQGKDAVQPANERNKERSMAQAECEGKGDQ
ncbi:MAG: competence protein [Bacillaceae bacterium]|nr:competence protein [Bacillaceae bacterium]